MTGGEVPILGKGAGQAKSHTARIRRAERSPLVDATMAIGIEHACNAFVIRAPVFGALS